MIAPTSISLNKETRTKLGKLKEELEERFQIKLSYSDVVLHLINYYTRKDSILMGINVKDR